MTVRVALSGSAGTGKSTLGRRLAAALGVPFIEEGMRERLERGLNLHSLGMDDLRELLVELWEEQAERQRAAARGFVADRSAADFAAFWIHYGFAHDAEATDAWTERMIKELPAYDRVLLFPWGVLPLRHDGVRSTNRWLQFKYQATVEGVLAQFAPDGLVRRVPATTDLDERLAFALASVRRAT